VADIKQFKLPDVGEGLTEAEILKWYVQPGDQVKVNQIIVEIETAKAAVELPSPFAGVVSELLFNEGTTVDVGQPIITIDTDPSGATAPAAPAAPAESAPAADAAAEESVAQEAAAEPAATAAVTESEPTKPRDDMLPTIPTPAEDEAIEPGLIGGPAPGGRTSVLVGYGPRSVEAKRRPRKDSAAPAPTDTAVPAPTGGAEPTPTPAVPAPTVPAARAQAATAAEPMATVSVLAKPPVRKLAKDLGVDLRTVAPTGPNGTITREDVHAAQTAPTAAPEAPAAASAIPAPAVAAPGYEFDPQTREYRYPIRSVRRMTAQAMVTSAFTAPHVTEFVTVDVTESMNLVERLRTRPEFAGLRVSPLLLVAKALLVAVRRNPDINATWDEERQEIVVKGYVNLGIAAATPRGLVVPNVKDAHAMSLPQLCAAINELSATAKEGKTAPGDMTSGTITITNVGVFGMDTGTPILNPGEAAILCFGAVRDQPWVHAGGLAIRKVTTLSLSFDHRLVDGELGSRFLADVAGLLEDPTLGLVWS
jgi:pyruvate dehydrogenase E2 component (dihydrolipoamide acetyltransferase)